MFDASPAWQLASPRCRAPPHQPWPMCTRLSFVPQAPVPRVRPPLLLPPRGRGPSAARSGQLHPQQAGPPGTGQEGGATWGGSGCPATVAVLGALLHLDRLDSCDNLTRRVLSPRVRDGRSRPGAGKGTAAESPSTGTPRPRPLLRPSAVPCSGVGLGVTRGATGSLCNVPPLD